jgi:hypothetical protein
VCQALSRRRTGNAIRLQIRRSTICQPSQPPVRLRRKGSTHPTGSLDPKVPNRRGRVRGDRDQQQRTSKPGKERANYQYEKSLYRFGNQATQKASPGVRDQLDGRITASATSPSYGIIGSIGNGNRNNSPDSTRCNASHAAHIKLAPISSQAIRLRNVIAGTFVAILYPRCSNLSSETQASHSTTAPAG